MGLPNKKTEVRSLSLFGSKTPSDGKGWWLGGSCLPRSQGTEGTDAPNCVVLAGEDVL